LHGGFCGDADYAEDVRRDGGARTKMRSVFELRSASELNAVVEEAEKSLGRPFEIFAVSVAEAIQSRQLGPGEEGFTFGLEVAIEFADEIEERMRRRGLFVLAVGREEIRAGST